MCLYYIGAHSDGNRENSNRINTIMESMTDNELIAALNRFERRVLELDWAKIGRTKAASDRYASARSLILTKLLGRKPTKDELCANDDCDAESVADRLASKTDTIKP